MPFIAAKPCNFGGTRYKTGEVIPNQSIDKDMIKKLIAAGKIVAANVSANSKQSVQQKDSKNPRKQIAGD